MIEKILFPVLNEPDIINKEDWKQIHSSKSTRVYKNPNKNVSAFVRPKMNSIFNRDTWEVVIVDRENNKEKYHNEFEERKKAFMDLKEKVNSQKIEKSDTTKQISG